MPLHRKQALIVFAKGPVPGRVKTRLVPPFTTVEAAQLYDCMLRDTLSRTTRLSGIDRLIFHDEEPDAAAYLGQIAPALSLFPQQGNDLGERMANAFRTAFDLGYREVAIIGSDSPDLPLPYMEEAFVRLSEGCADAIFGPSEDGGYYLVALQQLHEGLFEGIEWSRSDVLAKSLERAEKMGIRAELLPAWYDVDRAEDLHRPGLRDGANDAPLTREFVAGWLGRRGTGL